MSTESKTTIPPEKAFAQELEIFRTEAEGAAQFFYTYLGMHEIAKRHKQVFRMFDEHALFWNTLLGSVQTSALITLGRIFDQHSEHNIDTLLGIAQRNLSLFSKAALGKRKQGIEPRPPRWLTQYLLSTYEPTQDYFRRLRKHVHKHRRIYEKNYRDLRNQYYAHKQAADPSTVAALVAKTNTKEMERLFVFLLKLHYALQELFNNGTKPVFRPFRYSTTRMHQRPSAAVSGEAVHERIIMHAEQALLGLARRTLRK
jgi:hypothetical protein